MYKHETVNPRPTHPRRRKSSRVQPHRAHGSTAAPMLLAAHSRVITEEALRFNSKCKIHYHPIGFVKKGSSVLNVHGGDRMQPETNCTNNHADTTTATKKKKRGVFSQPRSSPSHTTCLEMLGSSFGTNLWSYCRYGTLCGCTACLAG